MGAIQKMVVLTAAEAETFKTTGTCNHVCEDQSIMVVNANDPTIIVLTPDDEPITEAMLNTALANYLTTSAASEIYQTKTGREPLDLSGTSLNEPKSVDTINNGIYDISKAGYICAANWTLGDKTFSPVDKGGILVKATDTVLYIFDGLISIVDTAGTAVTDWTASGQLINLYSLLETLSEYQHKPTPVTLTSGTVTLADNTDYTGTAITDLTFVFPNGDFECYISLTTASSGTNITFPNSAKFIGEEPTFSTGEQWEISIKNGVIVAGKVS